ncbi:MAG: hypothetical protein ACOCYZ_03705 [Halococcoides sp.]
MNRPPWVVLAVCALAVFGTAGLVTAAGSPTITDIAVSPSQPVAGTPAQISVDVAAPANDSGTITDVYVRGPDGTDLDRVEDVGTVGAGDSVSVPLSVTFDDPGTTRVRVHAVMRVDGETESVSTTRIVDVRESGNVLLDMPRPDPAAGASTTVDLGVSNGNDEAISSVELELSGNVSVENPRRVTAAIDPKTDETFEFDAKFPEAGDYRLQADLTYTTADGDQRNVSRTVTIAANDDPDGPGLEGSVELTELRTSGGQVVSVEGNIANVGGESVRSVLMSIEDTDRVTPREGSGEYFVGTINASTFETFELVGTAEGEPPETVPIAVEYITDGQRRSTTFDVPVREDGTGPAEGSEPDPDRESSGQFGETPSRPDGGPSGAGPGLLGILGPLVGIVVVIGVVLLGVVVYVRR